MNARAEREDHGDGLVRDEAIAAGGPLDRRTRQVLAQATDLDPQVRAVGLVGRARAEAPHELGDRDRRAFGLDEPPQDRQQDRTAREIDDAAPSDEARSQCVEDAGRAMADASELEAAQRRLLSALAKARDRLRQARDTSIDLRHQECMTGASGEYACLSERGVCRVDLPRGQEKLGPRKAEHGAEERVFGLLHGGEEGARSRMLAAKQGHPCAEHSRQHGVRRLGTERPAAGVEPSRGAAQVALRDLHLGEGEAGAGEGVDIAHLARHRRRTLEVLHGVGMLLELRQRSAANGERDVMFDTLREGQHRQGVASTEGPGRAFDRSGLDGHANEHSGESDAGAQHDFGPVGRRPVAMLSPMRLLASCLCASFLLGCSADPTGTGAAGGGEGGAGAAGAGTASSMQTSTGTASGAGGAGGAVEGTGGNGGGSFELDVHTETDGMPGLILRVNLPIDTKACAALGGGRPCDDLDADGITDAWENAALDRLRPIRRFDEDESLIGDATAVLGDVGRVAPAGSFVEIFIMLGYSKDYGSCGGFTSHNGDSERVALELERIGRAGAGDVRVKQAYTAAHEGTASDHSRVFSGADLALLTVGTDPATGEPRWVVFPSADKHGTYGSAQICEDISIIPCFDEDCGPDGVADPATYDRLPPFVNAGEDSMPLVTDLAVIGFPGDDAWATQDFCGGLGGSGCSDDVRNKLIPSPFR